MVQKMTSAISLVVKSIFLRSRLLYYFLRDNRGYSKTMVSLDVFFNNPSTLFPYTSIYLKSYLLFEVNLSAALGLPSYLLVFGRATDKPHPNCIMFLSSKTNSKSISIAPLCNDP